MENEMRHEAIRSIYPIAVTITGNVVTTQDGSEVDIDESLITPEIERLRAESIITTQRNKRNQLLAATDWTQVADAPVDQTAWATYRQSLRALPEQAGFPNTVTWPTEP